MTNPQFRHQTGCPRSGWTLLELLVALVIIGLFVALLLPAVNQVRAASLRMQCLNRLKHLGLALHGYHADRGHLPPGQSQSMYGSPDAIFGVSWLAMCLPYLEQNSLWIQTTQAFSVDPRPWNNPPHVGLSTVVTSFVCPADGRLLSPHLSAGNYTVAFTSYLGVEGDGLSNSRNGVFAGRPGARLIDITDGLSQTIMVGERPPDGRMDVGWWYTGSPTPSGPHTLMVVVNSLPDNEPNCLPPAFQLSDGTIRLGYRFGAGRLDNPCDRYHFWSLHSGGGQFLFADGSARFFSYSSTSVIHNLASINGGEIVAIP